MTYTRKGKILKNYRKITVALVVLAVVIGGQSGYSFAAGNSDFSLELSDTMWESAAMGTGVRPEVLYAIALQESRMMSEQGLAVPDPFVIRYGNHVKRFKEFVEARDYLGELIARPGTKLKRLDIGLMQINAGWHRH